MLALLPQETPCFRRFASAFAEVPFKFHGAILALLGWLCLTPRIAGRKKQSEERAALFSVRVHAIVMASSQDLAYYQKQNAQLLRCIRQYKTQRMEIV